MKAKCKKHCDLLLECPDKWIKLEKECELIINFIDKGIYLEEWKMIEKDILKIYTTRGNIEIVFTEEPIVTFQSWDNKDQLIFNIKQKNDFT